MQEVLVRAPGENKAQVIEFDAFSAGCAHTSVEFGLLLAGRLTLKDLAESLEKTLVSFPLAAGRLAKREGKVVLVVNNAGVPVSHCTQEELAPSFALPLPASLFDTVRDFAPAGEEPAAGAVLSLRLTDFSDRQCLCISFSHGVVDVGGASMLLAALAANCRGETFDGSAISFDRNTLPPTPGPGQPPLTERSAAPEDWQAMHAPPEMPEAQAPAPMAVASLPVSQEQCVAIKSRIAAASGGVAISTNDALTIELLLSFFEAGVGSYKGEHGTVHLVMDMRAALGLNGLCGNGVFTQAFFLPNSESAAGQLRQMLPQTLTKDYILWKYSQSTTGRAKFSVGELRFNSWVKALQMTKLNFGCGGTCEGVSVGIPTWCAHAAIFGKFHASQCIVTPSSDGVVMSVLIKRDDAQALVDQGRFAGMVVDL